MALRIPVQKDIGEYEEKIVGKMSLRTLACVSLGFGSAVGAAAFVHLGLHADVADAAFPIMAAVAAGALVVALGAGAARCAIAPQEGAQDSPQEQEQPAAAGADVATGKAASGAEALWNTACF